VVGGFEADFEAVDFAEPAAVLRFTETVIEIDDDGQQSRLLGQVGTEHWASNAGLTEMILKGAVVLPSAVLLHSVTEKSDRARRLGRVVDLVRFSRSPTSASIVVFTASGR
jgi:hypothetical protein